jgi:hypothetical protein
MELNLSPSPVRVTTPTMIPAEAQVVATERTPMDPPRKAATSFLGTRAVSRRMKLTAKTIAVDQKTARMGVKPRTMMATMAISEMK